MVTANTPSKPTSSAKPARKFQEVESPDFFRFENVKDSIEGKLLGRDIVTFQNGAVNRYTVETEDGQKKFLGSTVLDDTFANIPDGAFIRVTYIGDKKTASKRTMKDFKVEVAE